MKLVTQDYGCGTSSSILDYGIKDVVVVSETNYEHVFFIEDDLLFIGHDFLYFLWDNDQKLKRWQSRKGKWEHWVWCFERIDAIVPAWQQKSHLSLGMAGTFCNRVLACDEDDCDKYGFDWLPQWASCRFHIERNIPATNTKVLFSGQAGKPEYKIRTDLLSSVLEDLEIKNDIVITNISRDLGWDTYIKNLLSHTRILNPMGILKALNTRAYETITSGRLLLQQTTGSYNRHKKLLEDVPNVVFFEDFSQLKNCVIMTREYSLCDRYFENHTLFSRMKSIGVEIR